MKRIGFPISHKENENRRAVVPYDLSLVQNVDKLYFEYGYGQAIGYTDDEYRAHGANIVSREDVLSKEIICDPKIGDADYLSSLKDQTVFGWIHAVQNRDIADKLLKGRLTGIAWEDMYEDGRHTFYRNNELAGEAAVMHAFQCYGEMPYNTEVAILGRGNVANGALKLLTMLGAKITQYNRKTESLFRKELSQYDVIVNAILWDTSRQDHVIYRNDLSRLRKNALIIDISCDKHGGIETSIPTTIAQPTYMIDDIMHYVVDHTPALFSKTASREISKACCKYFDALIQDKDNRILQAATATESGKILDRRICEFQCREIN